MRADVADTEWSGSLIQYFCDALNVSSATLTAISLVCAVGMLCLKERLPHPPVAYLSFAPAVIVALLALHGFNILEIYSPQVAQQWLLFTVLAATLGTAVTLLAYILVFSALSLGRATRITGAQKVRHIRLGS